MTCLPVWFFLYASGKKCNRTRQSHPLPSHLYPLTAFRALVSSHVSRLTSNVYPPLALPERPREDQKIAESDGAVPIQIEPCFVPLVALA